MVGLFRVEPLVSRFSRAIPRHSSLLPNSFLDTFCNGACLERFPFKCVSSRLLRDQSASNNIPSDIYYLVFPNDPLQRKLLVYGVYAIELVQAIIYARMAYLQFAANFGEYLAVDTIPTVFWFGVPILISIGGHRPFSFGRLSFTNK